MTDKNKRAPQPTDVRGLFPIGRFWRGKWGLLLLVLLVVGTVYAVRPTWQENDGTIFGTAYHIKYKYHGNLQADIERTLLQVDNSLSLFNKTSTLSRINAGQTDEADSLFAEVFRKAQQVSTATGGAFDITVAPLVNAWGFGFKQGHVVNQSEIDSLRHFVGYEKVTLSGLSVRKADPRVMLDCGAIAKGYGVDCVARLLRSKGVKQFMVEIGGEVVVSGHNAEGKPWSIGIQRPTDDADAAGDTLQGVLQLTDAAMATSGNYRNYYVRDGRRYAHTIDPRTGRPVQHSLLSATVLASDCATADAYATAFMVLGLEQARQLLARHAELKAYLIYDDGDTLRTWQSAGLDVKAE